jgi:hypothetical protein
MTTLLPPNIDDEDLGNTSNGRYEIFSIDIKQPRTKDPCRPITENALGISGLLIVHPKEISAATV